MLTNDHEPDNSQDGSDRSQDEPVGLMACLMELERHIADGGWEQPPRLFALVPTAELAAAEPDLVASGQVAPATDRAADHLSGVEQDEFDPGPDLVAALQQIMWPEGVVGCAVSLVRSFLPAEAEQDIPDDPAEAEAYVQQHRQRQDVRAVVGVLRDGRGHAVARLADHPDDLLAAPDLLPGVARALADTFTAVPD